ncbi:MAG: serine hydrolase domain-containing protein [Lachnospiraceae bacterium]
MEIKVIDQIMQEYLKNEEMLGGALIVRKDDEIAYKNTWGYADYERTKITDEENIYRMCSMTKPVIAVGIMMLQEQGKLNIQDPVKKFLPCFSDLKVLKQEDYEATLKMPESKLEDTLKKLKENKLILEDLERNITICDLLSHSSGIGQGPLGMFQMKGLKQNGTLEDWVNELSTVVLDFQPGKGTGYSPIAGFDILGRIIEIVSKDSLESFCQKKIFNILEMQDTGFHISDKNREKLVTLCRRENGKLIKVSDGEGLNGVIERPGYVSGSAGLFSTIKDYEHFTRMLCNYGIFCGKKILKKETVELLGKVVPGIAAENIPGLEWGLGVIIRTNPKLLGNCVTSGTYGWSGAYGTHFFISPKDNLECVFVTNRDDLNGAESYISRKVEELVFGIYANK